MASQLLYPEKIDRDSKKTPTFKSVSATFGEGLKQSAPRNLNPVEENWSITWVNLSLVEKDALEASLILNGSWGQFYWIPCYETVQKVFTVSEDGYTLTRVNGNSSFNIACKLEQSFDLVT